jgi:hypothetical protein
VLVDQEGNVTVKSDATKQALEWFKKIVPFLPPDVFAWTMPADSRSNPRHLQRLPGGVLAGRHARLRLAS